MGKPRDKANSYHKGRGVKKGENSVKSVRGRKTEWSEQSDGVSVGLERLHVRESDEGSESGMEKLLTLSYQTIVTFTLGLFRN